jgi:hypothetical protein
MAKNIKKSLKYFIIFIGIIIILPTLFYFILRIPEVQTFAVRRISGYLSNEIQSTISVGKVEYSFFNKLNISDIIIKDRNNDTLFYSERFTAAIRRIDIKNRSYRFGKITLINPVVSFITDTTGSMNLTWYLNLLKSSDNQVKKGKGSFKIDQIDIFNAEFSMVNHSGNKSKAIIDFNNLKLHGVNCILENFKIFNDTTSFDIYNLGFQESNGFVLKRLSSEVTLAKQLILLNSAYIHCDSSILNLKHFGVHADSSSSFKNFMEEVKLDVSLDKSLINTTDLKYFIPSINGTNESVWITGKFSGTVSELRGRNIELSYRENTYLDCDFDFSGLTNIEDAYIYVGVNTLKTNATDIDKIYLAGKGKIVVPEFMYKLGNINFDGSFTGFITDFVTYGKITTSLGSATTDLSLRPDESNTFRIKGLITGSNIDLGELSDDKKIFGKMSMAVNIDGNASSFNKFATNITGRIDSIEFKKYIYRNIALNGFFTEKTWDGSIKISEENIKMDILGMFNFKDTLPEFDFTLNLIEANLHNLNFDPADSSSSLSMLLTSNFKGNSIDNLDGEIKLLNSTLRKYNNKLDLKDFSIKTYTQNNKPVLSIKTDFADADIKGYYSFTGLRTLMKSTLAKLMPTKFSVPKKQNNSGFNRFIFNINFKNTAKINNFFRTGLLLSEKSSITGSVFPDSIISIEGKAKTLSFKNNTFNDLSVIAYSSGSTLSVKLGTSSLTFFGQTELKSFSTSLETKPDNFTFAVEWDNKDKIINRGNFIARGAITNSIPGKTKPVITIYIDSSDIYVRNNLWKIKQSEVIIDSNSVEINKIYIGTNDHYYFANGSISEDPADTLHLKFNGIDMSPVNYLIKKENTKDSEKIPMNIKGNLNGTILLTNIYKDLLIESNIILKNFSILNSDYGDFFIKSGWDVQQKVVNISASNNLKGVRMLDIGGFYNPTSKRIDLSARADKLPIEALNPLLKVFASGITGFASGKVRLSGELNKLVLNGAIKAENAAMRIDYLQTKYTLNDTVRFDKNGIKFNNVKLADEKGNIAVLTGYVYHKYFKEYKADLLINTRDCMVLNTKPKDNELFYGTAYASGVTTIKTGPNLLAFDISAKTGKNTRFFIPINQSLSVTDYSFITFVDSKNADSITEPKVNPTIPQIKKTGIDLNFDLEITPDAEAQLLIDPKAGDVIKGHGSGNLNISLNRKGEFKISGDYIIEEGDYLFTLGNILNKSFRVESGGKIIFNGDVDNAEIDIKAIYKLKAPLYEIIPDLKYKERIPVECQLNLTGKLFNPVVAFNIYLPTADEETRTYLRNSITTEEELSRQFLYLLVMNRFLTTTTSTTSTGTSAMAVTTTEMLSNQVSNWLSQISNDFDIGFNYRPGNKSNTNTQDVINSQEVEVALSTQLLNDKVSVNGNFDVRGTGPEMENTNQITGDFDAEVKITEKIRFKVFNRYNNPYTGKLVDYTQGIGLLFRQEFDKFSDLFIKKEKNDTKRAEETSPDDK